MAIRYARGSNETAKTYGSGQVSNAAYLVSRATDAAAVFAALMACAEEYDWPTAAGSNRCVKFDLGYCTVTENRWHDYLPTYQLVGRDTSREPIYSNDLCDIIAEILRIWG